MNQWFNSWHDCYDDFTYGNWQVNKKQERLHLSTLKQYLKKRNLKVLKIKDIAYKGMNLRNDFINEYCLCCNGTRYYEANINYPCIVADNVVNPHNKKYRCVDGKHRLYKLKKLGYTEATFFVITKEQFLKSLDHSNSLIRSLGII